MAKKSAAKVVTKTWVVATRNVEMLAVNGYRYDSMAEAIKNAADDLGLEDGDDVYLAEVTVKNPEWFRVEKAAKKQGQVKLDDSGSEFVTASSS